MLRFGDPGKPYGYGRFGGVDNTQWCPMPITDESYTEIAIPGAPPWIDTPIAPGDYTPIDPTQPVEPCDDPHEAP
jgi:hypothetical protein